MISFADIPPEVLRDRHHLTPQQINSLYGQEVLAETMEKKATALETFREFVTVSDALDGGGISYVSLKGPFLALRLYGDITWRYYSDLDILTDVSLISKAIGILEELGYHYVSNAWPENPKLQKILVNHDNQISLNHPARMMTIELHWRLLKTPVIKYSRLSGLVNQNLARVSFASRSVSVLSNELELLYLIIHGGNHFWRQLKWLVDIDTFLRTQAIDKDKFDTLTHELKAERLIALCGAIYSRYFPEGKKFFRSSSSRGRVINYSMERIAEQEDKTHDTIKGIAKSLYFSTTFFPGMKYKMRIIRNYIFVKDYFGKDKIFSQIPLFYFYSVYKLLVNRIKRWN